ncbi:leucyl aminopeptidase [Betaproteobacteria bacterium SCN1]|jgi:leucyl aminopeptidase|nr:leucyl aminopeptidase [Betaproteobacteria bacterium SCN1]MBN8760673.1 leucyl aminopeptidase [Thiobacillus sp.]ODU88000.1 MAG: leucyl aminopeptidase [Thiobacillus sp. SCN 65-179]OJW36248.1 MAG: leucyl aminopeptidase [Thiobacillus sp. 65-69]
MENKEIDLEFSIKSGAPEKQRTACVVVGVFESRKLSAPAVDIDRTSDGYLSDILRGGDMDGKAGSTLLLHRVPNILADRVLLIGLGKERDFHEKAYRDAIACAIRTLRDTGSMEATITLSEIPVKKRDVAWNIEQAVIAAHEALYRFDLMKSKTSEPRRPLKRAVFAVSRRGELKFGEIGLARGLAIAHGIGLAKDLGNTPSNVCTPEYLATEARKLAKTYRFGCEVLDQAACEKLGMGSFLSVGKGSDKPPRFIVLKHEGGAKGEKPVVLVGKAITFDSGGISLKPPAEMDEMNYDMSGGGAVLGAFRAIGELGLKLNVVGLVPSCENMPNATANKPGDIVTSMSGQTIEILNTDAEGRLILCDALTYAERFEPEAVVDLATLTGACVIALGAHPSALYANHDPLAREIEHAADDAWDRVWRMPLWDDYQDQLKSSLADMANIGGRPGGSITAACFLSRFARKYHWAHLDIAGTAYKGGRDKGSTGRPVGLLMHFLLNRADKV